MEIASKNACVLLDGNLEDPPEAIEQFVWLSGEMATMWSTVVESRKSQNSLFRRISSKAFYWIFNYFSSIRIPANTGDFSLLERRVVAAILRFPERDLFLRGIRVFAGFKQTGVDYVRPERMFGRSTNNLLKNLDWAKKGILSFSNTPLNMMTFMRAALLGVSFRRRPASNTRQDLLSQQRAAWVSPRPCC